MYLRLLLSGVLCPSSHYRYYIYIRREKHLFSELTFGFSGIRIYVCCYFTSKYMEWEKVRTRAKTRERDARSPTLYGDTEGFREKVRIRILAICIFLEALTQKNYQVGLLRDDTGLSAFRKSSNDY